jgi:hypothetical protein
VNLQGIQRESFAYLINQYRLSMRNFLSLLLIAGSMQAQNIPVNTTPKWLDKNRVKARINTVNNKFWNIYGNGAPAYEVPVGKGANAQFANSIWIGGLDNNNLLHVSANTYRQNGTDFWPGPLDTTNIGAYSSLYTASYNQLWKVDCKDILAFASAYNNGQVSNGTFTVPADMVSYPAKGNGNFQRNLMPFFDANHDGQYNAVTDGDYPLIKGHQQILSIYNDTLGRHTETKGGAMGIEIYESAYAFSDPNVNDSMQAINFTTFYHYSITNRSTRNYYNVYITDWSDVDVGYWQNDYIGTDSLNNFTYCYNALATDPTSMGVTGYGNMPPVVCHALIQTDCLHDGIDNNNNGQTDEPGEQFRLDRSTYYNNNFNTFPPATTNPGTARQFYNYMTGTWKDNSPFTYGGNSYGGFQPTDRVYTGNAETNTGWTEANAGNPIGDRRVLTTSGPFNFPAGSRFEWSYAIVFSQDTTQAVNTITQFSKRVQRDVRNIRYYESTHNAVQCAPVVIVGLKNQNSGSLDALVYPNPAEDKLEILLLRSSEAAQVRLADLTGRLVIEGVIRMSDKLHLDLSGVEPGAYLLEIKDGDNKICRKVIRN